MTDETAFAATFGWIEYYAAPELEGSGTFFLITLYVYKFRGKIFIKKSIFTDDQMHTLHTASFEKVYRTIFQSKRRWLVFKTGVIIYIQNVT